jgi:hypothetical protein
MEARRTQVPLPVLNTTLILLCEELGPLERAVRELRRRDPSWRRRACTQDAPPEHL